ncbi:MAG: phage tail sheath subtilisin-like domain-containing protein [Euryarchaeota archaeon]|nr:phage tail sheath subtilisin-like domain-containing protein [Euryarchaeota archaeon]
MPVTPTYPGVYIEEVPSGVRTITGVATSITAFIGRASRGPVNEPITINSFGDYERHFGGLWLKSAMSFAVRDFFLNGGGQAIIVRLHNGATEAIMRLPTGAADPNDELPLIAANVGSWGNNLSAHVDYDTKDSTDTNLFNLTISEKGGITEKFPNVSVKQNSARYLPGVLKQRSMLVRVQKDEHTDSYIMPDTRPVASSEPVTPLSPPLSPPMSPPASPFGGSDGNQLTNSQFYSTGIGDSTGLEDKKEGIYAFEKADLFNLLCIPPYTTLSANGSDFDDDIQPTDITADLISRAVTYCKKRRAMLLIDPLSDWTNKDKAKNKFIATSNAYPGTNSNYAAIFFPSLKQRNPLRDNQMEEFVPCGAVAGIFARTDAQRGVWKAPAGQEAQMKGVPQLSVPLTDAENGELNQLGINCLRAFPVYGRLVWGSRTLEGADRLASEWKYISVRRMALFIEESLYRGTQWVVFEPNGEPLWAQIRLNVGAFMHNLFRQGAFQGTTPKEAYLVKCDKETTTQNDINQGIVNILVGFAPLKPAEFVFIKIQQLAGQIET